MPYLPHTDEDRRAMLARMPAQVGVARDDHHIICARSFLRHEPYDHCVGGDTTRSVDHLPARQSRERRACLCRAIAVKDDDHAMCCTPICGANLRQEGLTSAGQAAPLRRQQFWGMTNDVVAIHQDHS